MNAAPLDPAPRFPYAEQVHFATLNNRYQGQGCYVIGRGPTDFDYAELGKVSEPVLFINDAVCLETYCRSETFFFAHDAQMLPWLNGKLKSTSVVPIDGKVFRQTPGISLGHTGKIIYYRWRDENAEQLLYLNRDQIAEVNQLYTHTGTIHSVLHFIWFCGFTRISFVGCDCINRGDLPAALRTTDGYDHRLKNLSKSSAGDYTAIGRAQSLLTTLFGFEAIYRGTPKI
jgi:hypothetical protein